MKIVITKDYEELSQKAAEVMLAVVKSTPNAVLGLATGTTPLGLYARLIEDQKKNGTDYKNIRTVNLDEYKGLPASHEQSYAYSCGIICLRAWASLPKQTNIENGMAEMKKGSAPATTRFSMRCRATSSFWGSAATDISPSTNEYALRERYACRLACGKYDQRQRAPSF